MEVDEAEEEKAEEVTEARILVGGIGKGTEPEELVLQRFESRRMGQAPAAPSSNHDLVIARC